ncbi:hypothetical protein EmuJ_000366200 [Echinococcus multilocularis]|uniref:Uncharacterized protein n=1 Tax=Echinococcus multilocularis TaxID=6211 RepID=A0A068Y370_ECHMU|nr:hypothetical protein EmuJ_000366200 [Echinococcus multilocularis]
MRNPSNLSFIALSCRCAALCGRRQLLEVTIPRSISWLYPFTHPLPHELRLPSHSSHHRHKMQTQTPVHKIQATDKILQRHIAAVGRASFTITANMIHSHLHASTSIHPSVNIGGWHIPSSCTHRAPPCNMLLSTAQSSFSTAFAVKIMEGVAANTCTSSSTSCQQTPVSFWRNAECLHSEATRQPQWVSTASTAALRWSIGESTSKHTLH